MYWQILYNLLDRKKQNPEFPFLCLTVSGGHTQIILCNDYLKLKVIGQTLDDAAGEAFDKISEDHWAALPGRSVN